MELLLQIAGWSFVCYMVWCLATNHTKIEKSNRHASEKLQKMETSLKEDISNYKVYTAGHPYTWSEIEYEEIYNSICKFAGWSITIPWWHEATKFLTKIDEDRKFIYIVTSREHFDWLKLKHYEEWLESEKGVSKKIAEYKNS